jgi:inosose dehydratase
MRAPDFGGLVTFLDRVAAAPITWGIDPSPGWGYVIPRDRYVDEISSLGLHATELGPEGYLPSDPDELTSYLDDHALQIVGGWVPLALATDALFAERRDYLVRACTQFQNVGADIVVLGPVWNYQGYDAKNTLSDADWETFLANLATTQSIAGDFGLRVALHQHVGTAIETQEDVDRLLEYSQVDLCVDTGHMLSAGIDPVAIVRSHADRVAHMHLKDISTEQAGKVARGELGFRDAVKGGLFRPLGTGDVDLPAVIDALESSGYAGWYVIEQDCSLTAEPSPGEGPVTDCRISLNYLRDLAETRS